MDEFRVKYWCDDGVEGYVCFDSQVLAEAFYDSLDGLAEIQKYNEERHEYEAFGGSAWIIHKQSVECGVQGTAGASLWKQAGFLSSGMAGSGSIPA